MSPASAPAGRAVGPAEAPTESPTRAEIEAALAGDRAGMTALMWAMLPPIKLEVALCLTRYARHTRRDHRQDVNDFSHEIVVFLLKDRGHVLRLWDPQRGHRFSGFVRMIARQRVSRILQGHKHNPWNDDPTDHTELEPLLGADTAERLLESREELRGLLERLRANLTERGLLLFHRIYVDQAPIAEVAVEFGMTREAVDAWNTRTRILARRLARGDEGHRR